MTICIDRSNKNTYREQTKREREREETGAVKCERTKDINVQKQQKEKVHTKKIRGQTGQNVGGLDMEGKWGYTAVRFLLVFSRDSAEEMPLYTKERGKLQDSTVSALSS